MAHQLSGLSYCTGFSVRPPLPPPSLANPKSTDLRPRQRSSSFQLAQLDHLSPPHHPHRRRCVEREAAGDLEGAVHGGEGSGDGEGDAWDDEGGAGVDERAGG